MLHIRAIASSVPDARLFHAVQAQEKSVGYGHLLYPAGICALPRGRGHVLPEETHRLLPSTALAVPIAPATHSSADLALAAVAQLQQQAPGTLEGISHIVVTNAALNQRINESVAGRIQHHLHADQALPFAIGQSGTVGVFNALVMIEALLQQPGKVLLVASDKWLYPFFRSWGDLVTFGDGAAAVVLERADADASSLGVIRACAMHYGPALTDPWQLAPSALARRLQPLAVSAAHNVLQRAGLTAQDIDWVVPVGFAEDFARGVGQALGFRPEQHWPNAASVHPSSAGLLLAMEQLRQTLAPGQSVTALLWDVALCGSAGALVVQLNATSDVTGQP